MCQVTVDTYFINKPEQWGCMKPFLQRLDSSRPWSQRIICRIIASIIVIIITGWPSAQERQCRSQNKQTKCCCCYWDLLITSLAGTNVLISSVACLPLPPSSPRIAWTTVDYCLPNPKKISKSDTKHVMTIQAKIIINSRDNDSKYLELKKMPQRFV